MPYSDTAAPPTVSRPALLQGGGDAAFRRMIHALLSYARHVEAVRDGFGALLGISGVQYELLMSVQRLQGKRGVPVGQVATWMQRSGAFVTIEAGKLVRDGWLQKHSDPDDRRRALLRLTPHAETQLRALAPTQALLNDTLFETLSADEFAALAAVMTRLLPCGSQAAALIATLVKQQGRQVA